MSQNNTRKKWALILGGSSGIGLATARKLGREGFNLIIVHKDRRAELDRVNQSFDEIRESGSEVYSYNRDAVHKEPVDETMEEINSLLKEKNGKVDVLLHSIAMGNLKPLFNNPSDPDGNLPETEKDVDPEEITIKKFFSLKEKDKPGSALSGEDFQFTIQAMATSLHYWVKLLLESEIFSSDSRIIGLTSEGKSRVWNSYSAVSSAKSVLEQLIQHMAVELAPLGIRANLVQAGITETKSFKLIPGSSFIKKYGRERNPNKRLTTPEDVAGVIYLLTKEEAGWINGSTIIADGGEHLI